MNITNKSKRPISVPLTGGKKLFLGPGKVGQITPRSAKHPPLMKLVEAGDLEIDEVSRTQSTASSDVSTGRAGDQVGGPSGNIRRTGDR